MAAKEAKAKELEVSKRPIIILSVCVRIGRQMPAACYVARIPVVSSKRNC